MGICQVSQEWAVRYNGIGNSGDNARAITTDKSGNIYITGQSIIVTGTGNNDFLTIKYTSSGIQQWVARYNGPANDNDYAQAIVVDDSGNVYVTGSSQGNGTFFDYATVKYNSSGIQQWVARYNGIENRSDQSRAIAIDDFGNVFVTGESYSSISGYDCISIKYGSSGNQLWIASYNNLSNADGGFVLKSDKQGNVFVGGYSGNIGSQEDFLTIKYNSAGIQQWASMYDGITHQIDQIKYMVLDVSGNVYVTGSSAGTSNYADYAIIKYDSSGIQQWVRRYNGTADYYDRPCGLGIDKNGNIYVGGYSSEISTGYDYTAIKYNKDGLLIWISHYNNVINDLARSMTTDSSGNVYITGNIYQSSTGSNYATVKFDSNGVRTWAMMYSTVGDSNDTPNAVAVDNSGNVYVAGYVNQQNADCMTIKYSQLTGAISNESNIPAQYSLTQNYPNPFNPVTNLRFGISKLGFVALKVYDLLGNEVNTLVKEDKPAGNYDIEFDGSNLPSGIYFYSLLIDGNLIDTKRMILLK